MHRPTHGPWAWLGVAALIVYLASVATAQTPGRRPGDRIPGERVGTERWIVHLAQGSFDLGGLRQAHLDKRPVAHIDGIIRKLERAAVTDQAEVARAVVALGGRVLHHWWLINACAVEIPPAARAALEARDDVLWLEPESYAERADETANNRYNHNTTAAHALGHKGKGVAVAVMDDGADADTNGTGRPHAMYYVDGDPMNMTGGGIAGSRLVTCQQIGTYTCENSLKTHGTLVAAVVAGAGFGPSGSSDGQAPEAQIAAYSLGDDDGSGGFIYATTTTIVNAWQAVTSDVARYNIVAVNNSYGGSPWQFPQNSVQKALDNAVLTTDVTVVVASHNKGAGAVWGQAAINGIAVGAVEPDSHYVVDYSGRGPQSTEPMRFYPHMTACTHSIAALSDCEVGVVAFNGTSCATPQVAGAAAIVRAANPALRADETRALLLASTIDISHKNPDPPYNTRHAYGVGMLRTDLALQIALDPSLHARSQIGSAGGPAWQYSFPVVQGQSYTVVITWFRTDVNVKDWSDLRLQVTDGTQVVGMSDLPRNLYEIVRFTAASTGTYTAEVSANSLRADPQEVAIAIAPEGTPPDESGAYLAFGNSCEGSAEGADDCLGVNPDLGPDDHADWEYGGSVLEYALALPLTTQAIQLTGVELLGRMSDQPDTMNVALYKLDASGVPESTPVATGSMMVTAHPGWHRASFTAPYQAAAGEALAVGFAADRHHGVDVNAGTAVTWFCRQPGCRSAWVDIGSYPVGVRMLCGPGSRGAAPHLHATGIPTLGAAFEVHLERALPGSAAVLFTGASKTTWLGLPLPLDLSIIRGGTCSLLVSGDLQNGVPIDSAGHATVRMPIPAIPALVGNRVFQQWLVLDPAANPLGLALSGGGIARVGVP